MVRQSTLRPSGLDTRQRLDGRSLMFTWLPRSVVLFGVQVGRFPIPVSIAVQHAGQKQQPVYGSNGTQPSGASDATLWPDRETNSLRITCSGAVALALHPPQL